MTVFVSLRGAGRMTRLGVTVACGAVLLLSGCQKADEPGVASAEPASDQAAEGQPADGAASSAAGGVQAELAAYLAAKRTWVKCMREQGIELSDPDAKGETTDLYMDGDPKGDKGSERLAAHAACEKVDATPSKELEYYFEPLLTPAQLEANKGFSTCMRDNGIPDYADPKPDQRGAPDIADYETERKLSDKEFAALVTAQFICNESPAMHSAFPETVVGEATGPGNG